MDVHKSDSKKISMYVMLEKYSVGIRRIFNIRFFHYSTIKEVDQKSLTLSCNQHSLTCVFNYECLY